jgi:hypothetical protein
MRTDPLMSHSEIQERISGIGTRRVPGARGTKNACSRVL